MKPARRLYAAALLLLIQGAAAQGLSLESPREQVTVLELYTSHGCSSCPPADAWLRRLVDLPGLWRRLVPLAFHVGYWDYLGWSDRFAKPAFSDRQRDYVRAGGLSTVYTPAMVLNGSEWRDWRRQAAPSLSAGKNVGRLRLELEPGGTARLSYYPEKQLQHGLEAQLAIVGFGLATPIGGGENAGRTLHEDFVVLGTSRGKAVAGDALQWQLPWPQLKRAVTTRRAVVGWVSGASAPRPLQAVAGWLP